MIIRGEVTNWKDTIPITSFWDYTSDDPWAITVGFLESTAVWSFSLHLFLEAFTSPSDGLYGSGDVLIETNEGTALIHLSNGKQSATLVFSADEIREFLNKATEDSEDADEVVARELDDFLGAL